MVMLFSGQFFGQDTQATRHSQMDNYPAVREFQQKVFSASLNAQDGLVTQAVDFIRDGPAKATVADNGVLDGRTDQVGFNAPAAGFNFG
ncbi:hypothetical protein KATP_01290 [Kluyvera ascorbata]|nr:hypothetical protein KATP_01290 [Kluyvera ascorbata]